MLAWPVAPSTPRRTRVPTLAPPVFAFRTVRPPLIRTVRTDTTPRFSPPNRRSSPDVPGRSIDRLKSWTTYVNNPMNVVADVIPPIRAVSCARRAIRREVLLAFRSGNGSGSRGIPKSKVRCSR